MDWSKILQLAVPAAAGIGGAVIASNASGNAAQTQAQSADKAIQLQRDIFNQQQQNLQPWLNAGNAGLRNLMWRMGIKMPANAAPASNFATAPQATGGNPNVLGPQPASVVGRSVNNIGAGAGLGATIGSVVPGIGTAIGAGVGAAVGGVRSMLGTAHLNANNFVQNVENPFHAAMAQIASGNDPNAAADLQKAYQTYMQGVSQYQQAGGNNALVANQSYQKNPALWQTFNTMWGQVSGGQPNPDQAARNGGTAPAAANAAAPGSSPAGPGQPQTAGAPADPNASAPQNSNMQRVDANGNPIPSDPSQTAATGGDPNAPQDPNSDPSTFGQFNQTFDPTKGDGGFNPAYLQADHPFSMSDFQLDPGYQFRQDQGNEAIQRSAAAKGILNSGGTVKALDRYNQDYASNEFQNAYGRFNNERGNAQNQYQNAYGRFTNDQNNQFNRFASVAGIGQVATGQANASAGQFGNNASNLLTEKGNAQAAGQAASGAAWAGGLNAGANGVSQYFANNRGSGYSNNNPGASTVSNPPSWTFQN